MFSRLKNIVKKQNTGQEESHGNSHGHSHGGSHAHSNGGADGHLHVDPPEHAHEVFEPLQSPSYLAMTEVKSAAENAEIVTEQSLMVAHPEKCVFKIEGMCCASEVANLKDVLNPLLGKQTNLSFDLINAKLTLDSQHDNLPSKEAIVKAVAKTGMKAILWEDYVKQEKKTFWQRYGHISTHVISAASLVTGFVIHAMQDGISQAFGDTEENEISDYPPVATMVLYSAAIIAGGWFVIPKAVIAVRRLRPDTNLLMATATAGAVGINQWFEAATLMYLFSAAELLESWNVGRARKAIRALMELAPSTAQVIDENGMMTEQLVEQIPVGTLIAVRPGEKIPMDSILFLGSTSVNQAPITGESMPIQKEIGDLLFAGTINGDGSIHCKVTKAASDSTLASIIRKVEEAQSHRAQSDLWVEKFASYYVPSMMVASVAVAVIPPLATGDSWNPWIYKGLEFLVISCPCSLVISTPVSIVAGLTAAARSGVLIKGGIYLEAPAHLKAFAMDKTGTLTTGEPSVSEIIPMNGYNEKDLLKLAMALEIHSDHPVARAVQRKAKAEGILYQPAEDFQVLKGRGAEGTIDGKLFWIGSHRFLHEKVGDNEPPAVHEKILALEETGHSIIAIGQGQEIYGLLGVADTVRPESKNAIQAMKRAGMKVVMLTGDNRGAAKIIAESVGVDAYYAELLPEDKVTQLKNLVTMYGKVAMVGDGINDAPAMASSSLGIAMGAAGSDAAIETADIALMSDDLNKLAWLVNHSRHTINIIKQNVVFSLVVKGAFVGLTFADKASLWMAIAADIGASVIVVSNALRLLNNKAKKEANDEQIQPTSRAGTTAPPLLGQFASVQASSPSFRSQSSHPDVNSAIVPFIERPEVAILITGRENKGEGEQQMLVQKETLPSSTGLHFGHLRRRSATHDETNINLLAQSPTLAADKFVITHAQPTKQACCGGCKT